MHSAKMPRLNSLRLKVLLAFVAGTVLSITLLVVAAVVVLQGPMLARMDLAGLAEDMVGKVRFDGNGQTTRYPCAPQGW